jgi:ribose-phosphate pyrophosphokinase
MRSYADPAGGALGLVCTLDRPNHKILPLLFAVATARELGAASIGLVAPAE